MDYFKAYYDARYGKRNTYPQIKLEMSLIDNIIELQHSVEERRYKVGRSMCFISSAGKVKREIFAASMRDRIIHHLIFNEINPIFESLFIYDSYSCRKGKGTSMGIKRLQYHMRSCSECYTKPCWVLKCDLQGYFMSINRNKLFEIVIGEIDKAIQKGKTSPDFDYDTIKYLIWATIFNDPTKGCYRKGSLADWDELPRSKSLFYAAPGCGLPIGNLTSQLFSNVYLNVFDQWMKRVMKVKHYGRYVDDFFVISQDKQELLDMIPLIKEFLRDELCLTLHPKKIYLQPVSHGVRFLGAFVKPNRVYMDRNSQRRMYDHIDEVLTIEDNPYQLQSVLNSYKGLHSKFYGTFH